MLDGRKTFITNGGVDEHTLGDVFVVYAATGEREITHASWSRRACRASALGQKWKDKLGMRASSTAELVFEDCASRPRTCSARRAQGTLHMMRNLEIERLTLAAMSLGIAQRCLEVMIHYANERKSFGVPLREHGQIQRYIAESFAEYRAGARLVYDTARRLDLGADRASGSTPTPPSSSPRQAGKDVADAAIQVLGGYGYWASTWSSGSGATPSCSRSAAARSRRTRRTSPRTSRGDPALVRG